MILLAYRDAYYAAKESEEGLSIDDLVDLKARIDSKVLELGIGKNRQGPDGKMVELFCDPAHMHVGNLASDLRAGHHYGRAA